MNRFAVIGLLCLLAAPTAAYGTKIEVDNNRNPFEFKKDKTRKPVRKAIKVQKVEKVEVKVDLIMIKGSKKVAIIGDHSYRVGDSFNGNTITSITLNYVELSTQAGPKRLFLK